MVNLMVRRRVRSVPRVLSLPLILSLVVCSLVIVEARAQQTPVDTSRVYELETIVKTAERGATLLANTTSATSVINSGTIRRTPGISIADVLAQSPGISFFSLDGLGYDPQPVVRGFYGGGEAEYVLLQLDGQPVSDMESGLVNWHLAPVAALESVEILRGGSSALYGDAAVGAVINMVTPPVGDGRDFLRLGSGTHVPFETVFSHSGAVSGRRYTLFGGYSTIDGFRDHAKRDIASVAGRLDLASTSSERITVNTEHHWNYGDVPGPILKDGTDEPERSLPFFRYDRVEESLHRLGTSAAIPLAGHSEIDLSVSTQIRNVDAIETVPLSAGFADTQEREINDIGIRSSAQIVVRPGSNAGRLLGGLEASSQWLESRYYSLLNGADEDYANAPATPDRDQVSSGDGNRSQLAAYSHYDVSPIDRLRLTGGARLDVLRDRFDPGASDSETVTHVAFSPKIGVNYRIVSRTRAVTNVYANVSRSFKAPTFDQLYDQRAIPVPFPPFQVSLSSSDLKPQYGTSVETGAYHRFDSRRLSGEISVAVYHIDMRDEIDFDLQVLSYRNLGKSRHRGVESAIRLFIDPLVVHGSYAYQATTIRYGDFDGNFVKAIPRDIISAAIGIPVGPVEMSATLKSARRMFLDDANTVPLSDYTTVDARVNYDFGRAGITAEVFNVLDASFSTTGFPDPAGSEAVFVYPFTGRHMRLGAAVTFP